ncbi:MAG TPA: hypothetical protein VMC79_06460, partial [Rectinemataceae bacterium]|nr:hypothetical protein [Rectinemataceae bacterium]
MRGAAPEGRSGTRLRGLPAALCLVALPIFGQAPGPPAPRPGENLLIVERSDFSRYVNGSYVGHAYRESRAVLKQAPSGSAGTVYGGQAYLLEESLHDLVSQSRELDEALPLRLTVASDGSFAFAQDAGIPSLRGLTSPPADKRSPGSSWIVSGERMLDFGADGHLLRLPFLAECRFVGPRSYADRQALEFTA